MRSTQILHTDNRSRKDKCWKKEILQYRKVTIQRRQKEGIKDKGMNRGKQEKKIKLKRKK